MIIIKKKKKYYGNTSIKRPGRFKFTREKNIRTVTHTDRQKPL